MSSSPSQTEAGHGESYVGTGELLLETEGVVGSSDIKSLRKLLLNNTINKKQRHFLVALVVFFLLVATLVAIVVATKKPQVIEVIHLKSKETEIQGKEEKITVEMTTEMVTEMFTSKAKTSQEVFNTTMNTIKVSTAITSGNPTSTIWISTTKTRATPVSKIIVKTKMTTATEATKHSESTMKVTTARTLPALSKAPVVHSDPDPWCGTLEGKNCTFPMKYSGQTWFRCVPRGGGAWCATGLTRDRQYYTWGYCDRKNCGDGVYG